jgi:rubrerythrin
MKQELEAQIAELEAYSPHAASMTAALLGLHLQIAILEAIEKQTNVLQRVYEALQGKGIEPMKDKKPAGKGGKAAMSKCKVCGKPYAGKECPHCAKAASKGSAVSAKGAKVTPW